MSVQQTCTVSNRKLLSTTNDRDSSQIEMTHIAVNVPINSFKITRGSPGNIIHPTGQ